MIKIKSMINEGLTWNISADNVSNDERSFMEQFNPNIYHNDQTCRLWAFDEKMPSGRWLENITFNNEMTTAEVTIL